jgi:hypothetical protein
MRRPLVQRGEARYFCAGVVEGKILTVKFTLKERNTRHKIF